MLLGAIATFGLMGCGSDGKAVVEGSITIDGEPVNRGMISLEPADGKGQSAGCNVEGGKYYIAAIQPGSMKVRISAVKVVGKEKAYETADSPEVEITEELLPKKYNSESTLTLDVKAPRTQYDFKLESK